MIIRYEDLVRLPDRTMRAVLHHLDFPSCGAGAPNLREASNFAALPHLRKVLDDVTSESVDAGRANLSDGVRNNTPLMAAPVQIGLGYEPTGAYQFPLLAMQPAAA